MLHKLRDLKFKNIYILQLSLPTYWMRGMHNCNCLEFGIIQFVLAKPTSE